MSSVDTGQTLAFSLAGLWILLLLSNTLLVSNIGIIKAMFANIDPLSVYVCLDNVHTAAVRNFVHYSGNKIDE